MPLHLNDLFTEVDLDLLPLSVAYSNFVELLYWLHKLEYSE
ncbi:MAG: hypothetical protein QXL19_10855 [Ignisphaera sp.]